nr:hypothetical protein [Tanacetum cinerariifolium]
MEIQSIGLSWELMVGALFYNTLVGSGHGSKQPNALQKVDDDIDGLIRFRKTSVLDKLLKTTIEAKELQEKESKQDSVDKHTSCYGPNAPRGKSASTKLAKKQALATVKQTLERCHEFETTGKSSFTDNESGQRCPQLISNGAKGKRSISSVPNVEDDEPPFDFPHLEIPQMDVLGDTFGEQSLDVDSWLSIDDTILHDNDFIGLEIPMDDLSDIKMIV